MRNVARRVRSLPVSPPARAGCRGWRWTTRSAARDRVCRRRPVAATRSPRREPAGRRPPPASAKDPAHSRRTRVPAGPEGTTVHTDRADNDVRAVVLIPEPPSARRIRIRRGIGQVTGHPTVPQRRDLVGAVRQLRHATPDRRHSDLRSTQALQAGRDVEATFLGEIGQSPVERVVPHRTRLVSVEMPGTIACTGDSTDSGYRPPRRPSPGCTNPGHASLSATSPNPPRSPQ